MSEFILGEHVLVTTPGRDALAELRKAYSARASEFGAANRAFESLATADLIFSRYPTLLDRAFDQTAAATAEDISKERIYHWDTAALRRELEARAQPLRHDYDRLHERYFAIILGSQDREAIRAAEAGNGPAIIGGGFGVEGAAKGVAIAAAANAAIGVVQGAGRAVAKAAATAGDRQKKEELLKEPKTREILTSLLHDIVLEGHAVVANIVNRERAEPKFDLISAEAHRRAAALVENVDTGRVPDSDIAAVLLEALQLDPFREATWRLWLEDLGDADGGLARAAETLGVMAVTHHKSDLLKRKRAALAWSTPEECQTNIGNLQEMAQFLGLPFDEERRQIESRAKALDRERRTFKGSVYDTMEEANEARLAAEDLARRTVDGVVYKSKLEAEVARAVKADEAARTYRKFVYPTRNAAEIARSRHYRATSLVLWVAIIVVPFPAALFTLVPGFRNWQRATALLWMAIMGSIIAYGYFTDPGTSGAGFVIGFGVIALAVLGLLQGEIWVRKQVSRLLERLRSTQAADASAR